MLQEAADSMLAPKIYFPLSWGPAELSKGSRDMTSSSTLGHLAAELQIEGEWKGVAEQIADKEKQRESGSKSKERRVTFTVF